MGEVRPSLVEPLALGILVFIFIPRFSCLEIVPSVSRDLGSIVALLRSLDLHYSLRSVPLAILPHGVPRLCSLVPPVPLVVGDVRR